MLIECAEKRSFASTKKAPLPLDVLQCLYKKFFLSKFFSFLYEKLKKTKPPRNVVNLIKDDAFFFR